MRKYNTKNGTKLPHENTTRGNTTQKYNTKYITQKYTTRKNTTHTHKERLNYLHHNFQLWRKDQINNLLRFIL